MPTKLSYDQIHEHLSQEFSIPVKIIQHIRSSCISNNWKKKEYENRLHERLQQPKRNSNKPFWGRRRYSIKWYLETLRLITPLTEEQFEYIVTYQPE